MLKTRFLASLIALTAAFPAGAQECVTCRSSNCPDSVWLPVCDGTPRPKESSPARPAPARQRSARVLQGRVAVLEFAGKSSGLGPEQMRYFADQVRGAVVRFNPALEVITRENLIVLLKSNGKDPSQCEGECEVETGRLVNADAVISGDLLKVGSRFKLSLRLHETRDGRLLATSAASGKTVDELDENAPAAVLELLAGIANAD